MAGLCDSCGEPSEKLRTCEVCGATVCMGCKKPNGCKLCGGQTTF